MKNSKRRKIQFRKVNIEQLDDRTLLLNLYGTQLFTLLLGLVIIYFQANPLFVELWITAQFDANLLIWGISFAILVIGAELAVVKFVPDHVMDDGGINERIFRNRQLWHIAVISLVVAVCEEILFRGAIQHAFGVYWTSLIFTCIHFRYLKHWLMTGLVFIISYGLGWIYIQTGTLWTPILAHFLIDFILGCGIRYRRKA